MIPTCSTSEFFRNSTSYHLFSSKSHFLSLDSPATPQFIFLLLLQFSLCIFDAAGLMIFWKYRSTHFWSQYYKLCTFCCATVIWIFPRLSLSMYSNFRDILPLVSGMLQLRGLLPSMVLLQIYMWLVYFINLDPQHLHSHLCSLASPLLFNMSFVLHNAIQLINVSAARRMLRKSKMVLLPTEDTY